MLLWKKISPRQADEAADWTAEILGGFLEVRVNTVAQNTYFLSIVGAHNWLQERDRVDSPQLYYTDLEEAKAAAPDFVTVTLFDILRELRSPEEVKAGLGEPGVPNEVSFGRWVIGQIQQEAEASFKAIPLLPNSWGYTSALTLYHTYMTQLATWQLILENHLLSSYRAAGSPGPENPPEPSPSAPPPPNQ